MNDNNAARNMYPPAGMDTAPALINRCIRDRIGNILSMVNDGHGLLNEIVGSNVGIMANPDKKMKASLGRLDEVEELLAITEEAVNDLNARLHSILPRL